MRPALLLTVLIALLVVSSGAWAAEGSTSIDLGGSAVERLKAQKVKLTAKAPAKLRRGVLTLPVRQGLVSTSALLNHGGTLQLRKGKRVVRFTRLQSRLGGASYVNGTVGSKRVKLFSITGAGASLNPATGTASLRDARLSLTRAAARAIKRGLKLKKLPTGRFGKGTVDAIVDAANPSPGGGPTPGGPPTSGPISDEPPVLARPATAASLASASVVWHVRDSWVRYVSTEHDVEAVDGAVPGAAVPYDQHPCADAPSSAAPSLVYSYRLPFASGWHDAASGQTAIYAAGGTRFFYPGHGIDLTTRSLEIELTGATSRVIARFSDGANAGKRGVFFNLAAPVGDRYKGSIPSGGSESVFAGFYAPGAGFGCVSVSYSL
jgi:hypothetical protein